MLVTSTEFLHCDCLIMKAMCFVLCVYYATYVHSALYILNWFAHCEPAVHQFECATVLWICYCFASLVCVLPIACTQNISYQTMPELSRAVRSFITHIEVLHKTIEIPAICNKIRYVNKNRKAFQICGMINIDKVCFLFVVLSSILSIDFCLHF